MQISFSIFPKGSIAYHRIIADSYYYVKQFKKRLVSYVLRRSVR